MDSCVGKDDAWDSEGATRGIGQFDEIEFLEEWFEEFTLAEAKRERDIFEHAGGRRGADLAPVCVIPNSVRSKAIREGWEDDDVKWKRWMNDIDNRYLRISGGNL